jgi:UDP-glucose 6-dehydrogenase
MNKIVAQTAEGVLNPKYGTTSGHGSYGTCLPKDSSELRGLEAEYKLEAKLFKAVVDVNDIFVSTDKEPVYNGDNHMEFSVLAESQPLSKKSTND